MTDITKRLREYLLGDQLYHPLICDEAADEIGRLRAENGMLRREMLELIRSEKPY